MNYITVYSAGVRSPEGEYSQFIESRDREVVEEYSEIMKEGVGEEFTIIFHEEVYSRVCTTPHIVREGV